MDSQKIAENFSIPAPKMFGLDSFQKLMYLSNNWHLLGVLDTDQPAMNTTTEEEDLWDYGRFKRKDLHFLDCLSCWIRCMDPFPLSFPGPGAKCECQFQIRR